MWLAILSGICLAIMVITDKLMIHDCYKGDAKQALFVSSLLGTVLGLTATGAYWILEGDIQSLWNILSASYSTTGLLIIVAGAMSAQVLYHYFQCFSEDADTAVMASWLAATPIFVFVFSLGLVACGLLFDHVVLTPWVALGVIMTSFGLALLERYSYAHEGDVVQKHRKHLILMVLFSVVYVVIIDQALEFGAQKTGASTVSVTAALLPLYWLGFALGMRMMFFKRHRAALRTNWPTMRKYAKPIILVEILGMGVFFFEYLSLGTIDSISSSIIIGLHVIPVWIVSVFLTRYADTKKTKGSQWTILSIPMTNESLEAFRIKRGTRTAQLIFLIVALIGIIIFLAAST